MTRKLKTLAATAAIVVGTAATFVSCGGDDTVVALDSGSDAAAESSAADGAQDAVSDLQTIDVAPNDGGVSFNLWPPSSGPLVYWGGPVLIGSPNVYFVWYGNWKGSNSPAILEDLIKGFGETAYSGILTDYYQVPQPPPRPPTDGGLEGGNDTGADASTDAMGVPDGPREHLSGRVGFARSIYPGYTRGANLQPGDIRGIVTDLLRAGDLPYDSSAVYFVLTSGDVTENGGFGGFCSDYCGYHDGATVDGIPIQYAFVGDPSGCLDVCSMQPTYLEAGVPKSPNDNWSADAMASVIVHELCESMTDPQPYGGPAWQDQYMSQENGDMCAWRFEPTYPTLEGSRANTRFGQRDYLVQQMWVLDNDGGRCDLQR